MYRPAVGMFSPVGAHTPRLCGSNTRKNTRTDFQESPFRDEIGKRLPPPIPPGALNVDSAPPLPPKHPLLVHSKGLETFNHCKKASESLDLACKDVYESISDSNLSSRASFPCKPYSREPTSQDLDTSLSFLSPSNRPEVVTAPTKTTALCTKFQCPPTVSRSSGRDLSHSLCTCHLGSNCNVTSCTSKSYHNGESPIWSKMTTLGSEVGTRNSGSAHASYFSPSCTTVVTVCHPSDRPALSTVQPHFKDQPWNNRFDLAGSEPANLDKKAKCDANRNERPSTLTRFSRTLSRLFRLRSSGERKISDTPRSKSVYSSEVRENNRVSQAAPPAKPKSRGETRHLSCTCHMQSSSSCSSGRLHRGRASGKSGSWTPVTTVTAPLLVDHGPAALCYPHRYTEVSGESQRRSQPRSQQLVQSHQTQQQYPRSTTEQQQQSVVALLTPTAAAVTPSGDCIHNCVHHIHHIHHVHHVHHHLHHMPLDGSALSEVAAAVTTATEGSESRSPPPLPSAFLEGLPPDFTSSDAALVFQESHAAISSVVGNARPGASETKTSAAATRVCPRIVESPLSKGQLSELTSPVNLVSPYCLSFLLVKGMIGALHVITSYNC
ncbi:unnamed protein product [Schistocephalus solidus]|uniref:SH2 domain-containing protein n=1 Tax=Schistocephalus solidus TaxID=70667 RepID=A0A183TPS0_SCHSO|nr:unnamed protein product [Schistocephalus solidus]